jgi:hypothetical protein
MREKQPKITCFAPAFSPFYRPCKALPIANLQALCHFYHFSCPQIVTQCGFRRPLFFDPRKPYSRAVFWFSGTYTSWYTYVIRKPRPDQERGKETIKKSLQAERETAKTQQATICNLGALPLAKPSRPLSHAFSMMF